MASLSLYFNFNEFHHKFCKLFNEKNSKLFNVLYYEKRISYDPILHSMPDNSFKFKYFYLNLISINLQFI